ncbi:hypothetical protein [Natrinema altunense]|uniref:Uncharacterized protein n=1 Tax=Natrinema altunense (strain JCM 12890 / CGMCC 1.3731 / AJ2) TaxID=1227494 RepID=L9ZEM4_NATA2|nr:hypothetical protein [Natrinema altunense]ELY83628.1 hypothetical protein C485_17787 [Natrinema altunense JCM 12890]
MEPSESVDDSFRRLFDKAARIIHDEEDFEKAHETLDEHFNHLENGQSRAVYQVPSSVAGVDDSLVVKFALPEIGNSGAEDALYPVEYTEGWMSNWHEVILSHFDPLEHLLVPVIDHHEDALWTVMPYAETLPNSQEITSELTPLTEEIEAAEVEFVSHGETTGQPEIYQVKAWGWYNAECRLRDYGGIVVSDEEFLEQLPYPLSEPQI